MRACVAVIAAACGVASAAPHNAELAAPAPAPAPACDAHSALLLPASALAGSVKILPAPDGLVAFWTSQDQPGSQSFAIMYGAFTTAGKLRDKPVPVIAQPLRNVAAGERGLFGITYQVSTPQGWQGHVALVRPDQSDPKQRIVWDVALPMAGRGHGTLAIGWDPRHRQWVIAGEELFQLPKREPGYVYQRLFTARFDERGAWVEKPTYLTAPNESVSLSDWSNPMVWANDRMAVVWSSTAMHISELEPDRATQIDLPGGALTRAVIAPTRGGYVMAGGEPGENPLDSRLAITIVRDGAASHRRYLSSSGAHGGDAVIASDGTRVAVAWNEDELAGAGANHRTSVHAMILEGGAAFDSKTPRGRHDWVQSLAWDGCRFSLVHTEGIDPSAIRLVQF